MPRLRLTSQHVESLPAKDGKRIDYYDVLVPALCLRVTAFGARSWAVDLIEGSGREGRRKTRVTLGPAIGARALSLAEAREDARRVLESGKTPERKALTVGALIDRALAALTLRPSTRTEWERLAKVEIKPHLGTRPAVELQRAEVRAWARDIGQRSTWTALRAFQVLRRCYSWGVVDEELIQSSPCDRLRLGYEQPASERVLSRDELRRLLGALDRLETDGRPRKRPQPGFKEPRPEFDAYVAATRLLLLTAVRRDAVLGARADESESGLWTVPAERSKGGRVHVVPLSPAAEAVFKARAAAVEAMLPGERLLFPQAPGRVMTWSSVWVRNLCEEMQAVSEDWTLVPDPRWRIHDLRHTAATVMTESLGVSREVVALLLGHSFGPRITRVYDRGERLAERRAALERWADWLERLKEPAESTTKIVSMKSRRRRS
jgi:integrase